MLPPFVYASDRCIPICHYYSRMGNGCQHLRHTIFKIRGHTPNTWHTARVRHIASCSQRQHTARQHAGAIVATRSRLHAANNRSTWNHSRQHPTPPTRGTTVANNTWNPIHPSSRGRGGCRGCRGCRGYCACRPCCPAHADGAAPGPPPPPPRITACHPTPQHDTNTPPPPHGRSGQDITGVAVEEEGGGFPMCVSTQAKSIPL